MEDRTGHEKMRAVSIVDEFYEKSMRIPYCNTGHNI